MNWVKQRRISIFTKIKKREIEYIKIDFVFNFNNNI